VSSAIERVKALIAKDWKLRDRVERFILLVSKSQKQTCPFFFIVLKQAY